MSDIRYPHRNEEAIRNSERTVTLPISVVETLIDYTYELINRREEVRLLREENDAFRARLLSIKESVGAENARKLGIALAKK